MYSCDMFEKGSLSFRVGKKSVAIVLSKYSKPHKVLKSVPLRDVRTQSEELRILLSLYKGGQSKWNSFVANKLPNLLKSREDNMRIMSYAEIKASLADIAWSMERQISQDKTGDKDTTEVAVAAWIALQSIRNVISHSWGITESQAKEKANYKKR